MISGFQIPDRALLGGVLVRQAVNLRFLESVIVFKGSNGPFLPEILIVQVVDCVCFVVVLQVERSDLRTLLMRVVV